MIKDPWDLWEVLAIQGESLYTEMLCMAATTDQRIPPEHVVPISFVLLDCIDRHAPVTLDGLNAAATRGRIWSLIDSSLRDSDFSWAEMLNCICTLTDFQGASFFRSAWMTCSFRKANFQEACLDWAVFKSCPLQGASFLDATLYRTEFDNCIFEGFDPYEPALYDRVHFSNCRVNGFRVTGEVNVPDDLVELCTRETQITAH